MPSSRNPSNPAPAVYGAGFLMNIEFISSAELNNAVIARKAAAKCGLSTESTSIDVLLTNICY